MNNISKLSVLLLTFSLTGPYYASAESAPVNNVDLSTQTSEKASDNTSSDQVNTTDTNNGETDNKENENQKMDSKMESETSNLIENSPTNGTNVSTEDQQTKQQTKIQSNVSSSNSGTDAAEEAQLPSDPNSTAVDESKEPQKTVSLQTFAAANIKETTTSRLGHIRSSSVKIHKDLNNASSVFTASTTYTDQVFYIKKQANVNGQIYYLLSTEPSSEKGVVGWVKAADVFSHPHTGVDHNAKTFYVKATHYSAYSKPWGGKKNVVFEDLANYTLQEFKVSITEKVGNNIWYYGVLNGKNVWLHSSYVLAGKESKTSRLGHILYGNVTIYGTTGDHSVVQAGSTYTDRVFYIKKQATIGGVLYYLLSTQPSSEKGVIGWAKASELFTHPHVGVDENPKTFYVKDTHYSAYLKAWGGQKDIVFADLSEYTGEEFQVQDAEKVGNNIWYRGMLHGKLVWLHSSYVTTAIESKTSRLGHILDGNVKIYKKIGDESTAITAGSAYMDQVYYIKKQVTLNGVTYYLLSKQPSSEVGIVGWVKAGEIFTHPHVGVDHNAKTFYIKDTQYSAYSKAWGGKKDIVFADLSEYKYQEFPVFQTEKVGNNIWYRGTLNGKTVWLHASYLIKPKQVIKNTTTYDLSVNQMVDIQMKVNPLTDKPYQLWIREDAFKDGSIRDGKGTIEGDNWNLRRGPGASYAVDGQVDDGTVLTLYSSTKGSDGYTWYYVRNTSGWVTPDVSDVKYYLDYNHFVGNLQNSLQFLNLSQSANINVAEVNAKILNDKGILAGRAQAFVDAGRQYGVNEIYLISHALLETGNGTSDLANGVEVGKDRNGNLVVVTSENRSSLTNIKKAYNMYGIDARDTCVSCGSIYAYNAGWFTPEQAIIGGAAFIGNGYVNKGQDTLYKMRWNPAYAESTGSAGHQYATDIGWAYKQTSTMHNLYSLLDHYILVLDLPKYN